MVIFYQLAIVEVVVIGIAWCLCRRWDRQDQEWDRRVTAGPDHNSHV